VARVDGNGRAGGMGIVGACDIAVSGPASSFAFTEARLGLAPAIISLTTLGRMTDRAASRYFLTGETFDAAAAAACGLVTIAADNVDAALAPILDSLRKCAPQGLLESKRVATAPARADFAARADEMQQLSERLFGSEEAREGIMAFLEKRPPSWATQ